MSRKKHANDDSPGQDSFLDVIANLVGILIILVMVIGAHAAERFREAAEKEPTSAEMKEVAKTTRKSQSIAAEVTAENIALEKRIQEEKLTTQLVSAERNEIQKAVLIWEDRIKELENAQPAENQQKIAAMNRVAELQFEYSEIVKKIELAKVEQNGPETITHYPTPIAKTVFGDELHFRLTNGRIALVPLDDLVDLVKNEVNLKMRQLKNAGSTLAMVGPIEGFRLQYELVKEVRVVRQDDMAVEREIGSLKQFVILDRKSVV